MSTPNETAEPRLGEGLTFEKVWASLMELREAQKETDRQMKETDKRVGEITNRFGDMVEHMVVPNMVVKFQELGFTFTKAYPNAQIVDREHGIITEVDAFLKNGDKVMIVEIKTKPISGTYKITLSGWKNCGPMRIYAGIRGNTWGP
jgi:hypothetical protein